MGFVVLGLIYGEGDFKKSIIYTVNCGDDTDCTAGTVGAVLGILGGSAGIPADWKEYTEGPGRYDKEEAFRVLEHYAADYYKRSTYSFDMNIPGYLDTRVEFEREPIAVADEPIRFCVRFKQLNHTSPIQGNVSVYVPEGWNAKYRKTVHISRPRDLMEVSMPYEAFDVYSDLEVTIVPGEKIDAVNRIYVNIELSNNCVPLMIPVVVMG